MFSIAWVTDTDTQLVPRVLHPDNRNRKQRSYNSWGRLLRSHFERRVVVVVVAWLLLPS